MLEDTAVFSGQACQTLPEERRRECEAVKNALELIENGRDDAAAELLQTISRQSPYSDWRLFLRGLTSYYQQAIEEAVEAWSRLTPSRRPARIACVLLDAVKHSRPESLAAVAVASDALPRPNKRWIGLAFWPKPKRSWRRVHQTNACHSPCRRLLCCEVSLSVFARSTKRWRCHSCKLACSQAATKTRTVFF